MSPHLSECEEEEEGGRGQWRYLRRGPGAAAGRERPTMLPAVATSWEQKPFTYQHFLFGLRSGVGSRLFEEAPF